MVNIKELTETEYKAHLKELGIKKEQIDDIWDKVLIERKREEYKENREVKKKK